MARRGKLAAEVAVRAAQDAAEAAAVTASAAKAALDSVSLAEASAVKTANSAGLVVENAKLNSVEADAEAAQADIGEQQAREEYRGAAQAALKRQPVDR